MPYFKIKTSLLLKGLTLGLIFSVFACKKDLTNLSPIEELPTNFDAVNIIDSNASLDYRDLFNKNTSFISQSFDFPVGKPLAKGYYNAQKFGANNHLGDDWNGVGGGNSDLGDPIYAISNGYISEVKDYEGGWGKVVRIVHSYKNELYLSLYAHCDSILVTQDQFIKRGQQIATIGNCNGQYYAHLHLEIRDSIPLDIGGGYSTFTEGYLDPTAFIKNN